MCSRHETQHMPRLRLAPFRAHPRFRAAVAELGVVRRFLTRFAARLFSMNSVQKPNPDRTDALQKWSFVLLAIVVFYVTNLARDIHRLEQQISRPPTPAHIPTATEIVTELRKTVLAPPQFQLRQGSTGWNGKGLLSVSLDLHRSAGTASDLAVTATDGIASELHTLGEASDPSGYSIDFVPAREPLPDSWSFTLEFTTLCGSRERRVFKVSRDATKAADQSLIIQ